MDQILVNLLKNKLRNVVNNSSDVLRSSTNSPIVLVTIRICSRLSGNDGDPSNQQRSRAEK